MERAKKVDLHDAAGLFSAHLEVDIVQLENRMLQTNQDLEEMNALIEDLQARQDEVNEDDDHEGRALTAVEAFGKVINHMNLCIAHMVQKKDVLNMALKSARAAGDEMHHFANAIPGIPTIDEDSE